MADVQYRFAQPATPQQASAGVNFRWAGQAANEGELAMLRQQLADVDRELAEFDRLNPGIASGEAELAANRAAGGDIGFYTGMAGRAAAETQRTAAQATAARESIENALDEASRNAYGLEDEMFGEQRKREIETQLNKAERMAANSGLNIQDFTRYQKLREQLHGKGGTTGGASATGEMDSIIYGFNNVQSVENLLASRKREGRLVDDDIKILEEFIKDHPADPRTKDLRALVDKYKGGTRESGAAAEAENRKWDAWFNAHANDTKEQARAAYAALTEKEIKQFNKRFNFNPETGVITRK